MKEGPANNGSGLKVAVIVPVYNAAATLEACLQAIKPSTRLSGWELIVVDDASTDGSARIAKRLGARVIKLERNLGVSAARNIGARATDSDILIFVDADIVPQPGALEVMANTLQARPDIYAVGAYALPGDLSPEWSAHFDGLRAAWDHHWNEGETERSISCFQSECGAIRKSTFEALDGFSERYGGVGMEEFHMAHEMERKGYRHLLLRSAAYHHYYKTLSRRCLALLIRTARWVSLLLRRKKFESRGAVGTVAAVFSCILTFIAFTALIAGLFMPWMAALAGLIWLIQLIVEWGFLGFARKMYGWPMVFYAFPALQVMHIAIGLGFIWGSVNLLFTSFRLKREVS